VLDPLGQITGYEMSTRLPQEPSTDDVEAQGDLGSSDYDPAAPLFPA
jgi:hypothetical protein